MHNDYRNRDARAQRVAIVPGCAIGLPIRGPTERYPGSPDRSPDNSNDGEDFTGNFTWADSRRTRLSSATLTTYSEGGGWWRQPCEFAYVQVWYVASGFAIGLYEFRDRPLFYALIRKIARGQLGYRHLFDPVWILLEIQGILRHAPSCLRSYFDYSSTVMRNAYTSIDISDALLECSDPNFMYLLSRAMSGGWNGVSRLVLSGEALRGRFHGQSDRTEYASSTSPPVFRRWRDGDGVRPTNWNYD